MRNLFFVALLAGCGGGQSGGATGTYSVSWTLTDSSAPSAPTCTSYQISDVVVSAVDTVTGDTDTISVPCEDGAADLSDVALGDHQITLDAIGDEGDVAGTAEGSGALTTADQIVTLTEFGIPTLPPSSAAHATWTLRQNGTTASCGDFAQTGVEVANTPAVGTPLVDIWDCNEPNATVDVPYGNFTVTVTLLGANDVPIASSPDLQVDAARGTIPTPVTIDVP